MDTHGTPQTDRSIDARLARIEADLDAARRDARRWRRGTFITLGVAGTALLAAAMQDSPIVDVIRTRRIEVVGADDKVMLLAHAGETGGQLDVWSKTGSNTVRLGSTADGGDLALWNAAGKPVAGLFATGIGGRIEIGDADGTPLATFARGADGGAMVLHGAGQQASSLRAEAGNAGAVISMTRPDGEVGMLTGVAQGAAVLSMRNATGKEVLYAGAAADQSGFMRLADAEGDETASLVSTTGGSLMLKDGAGAMSASLTTRGAGKGAAFEILNGTGAPALALDSGDDGAGRLMVGTATGVPAFMAEAKGQAGTLSLYSQERRVAAIGAGRSGGLLNLLDLAGRPIVVAGAASDGDGGAVSVRNSTGAQIGRLGVDASGGGELAVYNASATVKKLIDAPAAPGGAAAPAPAPVPAPATPAPTPAPAPEPAPAADAPAPAEPTPAPEPTEPAPAAEPAAEPK